MARDDLGRTTLVEGATPELSEGEALLRVDRVGLTANNVTYAVLGDSMRYWQFFPPGPRGLGPQWGLPPLWGFAEVVASTVPGVAAGQRVYGYLPSAGHLVVRPGRVDARGFRDVSGHRVELPSPYQAYRSITGDPAYRSDQEDLLILFRPLFFTSFMLADQVIDNDFYRAASVVLSSASSKTAYAAACELHGRGPRLVGLTSPGNREFTQSLGCYDEVVSYDEIGLLDVVPTAYLDLSGAPSTRAALRRRLGDRLVRDVAVGLTSRTPNADAAGEVFFAPVHMRKRRRDWGADGLDQRFTDAWRRFAEVVGGWLDVRVGVGSDDLRRAWLEVLAGRTPPRVGHVVQL
ncbi:NADPH-dependent curcumin reductase CurA [Micromonospora halophytica]|uniref:NADPH-dependent curcumin reductase CurA n=1 Tax=Micromonospora halophytica TaxID=47864 RepID=A0A1C5IKC4_9ACTN|nr:NADPH-dependent curcumin reductase CurA [Micromonospora halophytica]